MLLPANEIITDDNEDDETVNIEINGKTLTINIFEDLVIRDKRDIRKEEESVVLSKLKQLVSLLYMLYCLSRNYLIFPIILQSPATNQCDINAHIYVIYVIYMYMFLFVKKKNANLFVSDKPILVG